MSEKDKYYMPKYLDQPFRFATMTIDELFVLAIPVIIMGFIFHQMILGFVLSMGGFTLLKKLKGEQGHFYLINLGYWHLPEIVKLKYTPPSYIRDYLG